MAKKSGASFTSAESKSESGGILIQNLKAFVTVSVFESSDAEELVTEVVEKMLITHQNPSRLQRMRMNQVI